LAVPAAASGLRLDVFVTHHWIESGLSRSAIQKLIADGHIKLNRQRAKGSVRIREGDSVEIEREIARDSSLVAENLPLEILFEDDDCIVINKAAGVVVHPAAGKDRGTVVNALLHHCPNLEAIGGERRPGIVHRLDKDTSGVMIIAKNPSALENLARQFRNRTVEKQYLALVAGQVPGDKGVIDRPIGRHRSDRKRMSSRYALSRQRQAVTEWQVVDRFHEPSATTFLRLRPKTGRTHQIRVHLADFGFPIVGDRLYGRSRAKNGAGTTTILANFPRQALHAERLAVDHPGSKKRMEFVAPLPVDMRETLAALGGQQDSFTGYASKHMGLTMKRVFRNIDL
jgi:23S rRNA pseudouridine1911/1915/1917 synthase